jgi:L-2-hydroxyglutarate oxidase LhgO
MGCRHRLGHSKSFEVGDTEPLADLLAAIRIFDAGIVDYKAVCRTLAQRLEELECGLYRKHKVSARMLTAEVRTAAISRLRCSSA